MRLALRKRAIITEARREAHRTPDGGDASSRYGVWGQAKNVCKLTNWMISRDGWTKNRSSWRSFLMFQNIKKDRVLVYVVVSIPSLSECLDYCFFLI